MKLWPYYAMLLPGLVFFFIFKYIPMSSLIMVFKDFRLTRGVWGSKWNGIENFRILFQSYYFPIVLRNTILISIYKLVCFFPAPIVLALLLNEVKRSWIKRIFQTAYYLPRFVSWIVISNLITVFFAPESGVVTGFLSSITGKTYNVLINPDTFRSVIVISSIWRGTGWGSIIYLAAITGIDESLYEAAIVDGASRFQQIVHITVPCILPTILTMLMLQLGQILNVGFEQILAMINSVVYDVAEVLDTYVYTIAFTQGKYALASAAGLFKSVIGLVLVLIFNKIANKIGREIF